MWDTSSYSNILVYDETQWVAYVSLGNKAIVRNRNVTNPDLQMNDSNKAVRKLLYESLSFLGISDWAVDPDMASDAASQPNDYLFSIVDDHRVILKPHNSHKYPFEWCDIYIPMVYLCVDLYDYFNSTR